MTPDEFAQKVEWEGWEYALRDMSPSQLEDAPLAEALLDAQEAFRILVNLTPDFEATFSEDEDEPAELNFDQD